MNNTLKPNDMFVATISNVGATTLDLVANDINFDNTQFLSKEEYKSTPFVQKLFTKDDVFDENAFNAVYDAASEKYNELSEKRSYDGLEDFIEFDPLSASAPLGSKKRSVAASYDSLVNPKQQKLGVEDFNTWSTPEKSLKELAQSHKIWDASKGKWLEDTPESLNLFEKAFGQSLVYAKYEQTGEQINPITGELGYHEAGEWITDEKGEVFTQYAPNKDLMHSEVVAFSDIMTDEGSALNAIDVFDSDDLHKSAAGIAMKTVLKIVPYLIPGVNKIWGAATAALGTMAALPTLYKSVDALFTGASDSNAYKAASGMENWFKKFESSMTDEGKSSLFTLESSLGMISDIFGQLYQQKAAAKLGTTLAKLGGYSAENIDDLKKISKLGQQMSLGYMALTSTADIYNEALRSGYDERTAAVAGLMSAGALFGIMNLNSTTRGISNWFLGTEDGIDTRAMGAVSKAVKDSFKNIQEGVSKGLKGTNKTIKKRILENLDNLKQGANPWVRASVAEALEETSEEVIQDAVKGIIDGASALGLTKNAGSFGIVEDITSGQGLIRYVAAAVGGGIGGPMFHLQQTHIEPGLNKLSNKLFGTNFEVTPKEKLDQYNLTLALLEGRYEDIMSEIDRCKKFLPNGEFTGVMDMNGKAIEFVGKGDYTYADAIAEIAKEQVKQEYARLNATLGSAMLDRKAIMTINDNLINTLKDAHILNESGESAFLDYLNKKNASYIQAAIDARDSLESLIKSAENDPNLNDNKKLAQEKYDKKLEALKEHFSEKGFTNNLIEGYMLTNLKYANLLNPHLSEENFWATFYKDDAEFKAEDYGKLTEEQKTKIKEKLEIAKALNSEKGVAIDHKNVETLREIYLKAQQKFSKAIKEFIDIKNRDNMFIALKEWDKSLENIRLETILTGALEKEQKYLLNTLHNYGLYKFIQDNETVDLTQFLNNYDFASELFKEKIIMFKNDKNTNSNNSVNFSDEKYKKIKDVINRLINFQALKSGITTWNKESVLDLVLIVNLQLNDKFDIHTVGILKHLEDLGIDEEISFFEIKTDFGNEDNKINAFLEKQKNIKVDSLIDSLLKEDGIITNNEFEYILKSIYNKYWNSDLESGYKQEIIGDIIDQIKNLYSDFLTENESNWIDNYTINFNSSDKVVNDPFSKLFTDVYFDLFNKENPMWLPAILLDFNNKKRYPEINNDVRIQIENTKKTLNFIKYILNGMLVEEDGLGINNMMKTYIETYSPEGANSEDYVTINDKDLNVASLYLDDIYFKLTQFRQISDERLNDKKEKYLKIKENIESNLIKYYSKFDENSEIGKIAKSTFSIKQPDETKLSLFRYNLFNQKNNPDLQNELKQLIENLKQDEVLSGVDVEALFTENENDLSNLKHIALLDLIASCEISIYDFKSFLQLLYENTQTIEPRFDLEFALWLSFAKLKNNENSLFNDLTKKLNELFPISIDGKNTFKDDKDNEYNKQYLKNSVSLYGPAGSGKSLILEILLKLLKDKKYIVTSTKLEKVDSLKKSFSEDDTTAVVLTSLFKEDIKILIESAEKLVTKKLEENKDKNGSVINITVKSQDGKIELVGDFIIKELTIYGISNIKLIDAKTKALLTKEEIINNYEKIKGLSSDLDAVVFDDEVQLLNPFINAILDQLNIPILRVGAPDLLGFGFDVTIQTEKESILKKAYIDESYYTLLIIPKLIGTYRANNPLIAQTAELLGAVLNKTYDGVGLYDLDRNAPVDTDVIKALKEQLKYIKIEWSDTIDNTEQFVGVRILDDNNELPSALALILKAIANNPEKQILVIVDDVSNVPAELKNLTPNIKTIDQALGSEFDYVVYYLPKNPSGLIYTAAKKIYTAITRAKDGVLIVPAQENSILKDVNLPNSVKINRAIGYEPISVSFIKDRATYLKKELDVLKEQVLKPDVNDSNNEEGDKDFGKPLPVLGSVVENIHTVEEIEEKIKLLEGKENKTETEKKQLERLKQEQKLPEIYKETFGKNWRTCLSFYIRTGQGFDIIKECFLNKDTAVNKDTLIDKLKQKMLDDLSFIPSDFAQFILLFLNESVSEITDDEYKAASAGLTLALWSGLFNRFIIRNFTKNNKISEFQILVKKYNENEDGLLYKENNVSERNDGDTFRVLQGKIDRYFFTLGQLGFKNETDDLSKELLLETNGPNSKTIPINLLTIDPSKIEKDKWEDRKILTHSDNRIIQVKGIRTTSVKDKNIIVNNANAASLNSQVTTTPLEKLIALGYEYKEINEQDLNKNKNKYAEIISKNSIFEGTVDVNLENFKGKFYRVWIPGLEDKFETAILANAYTENITLYPTKGSYTTPYNYLRIARMIDYILHKSTNLTKDIEIIKKDDFHSELKKGLSENTIKILETGIENIEDSELKNILQGSLKLIKPNEKTGISASNYMANKHGDLIRYFNENYKYFQYAKSEDKDSKILTNAAIEHPTFLFIPQIKSNKIDVMDKDTKIIKESQSSTNDPIDDNTEELKNLLSEYSKNKLITINENSKTVMLLESLTELDASEVEDVLLAIKNAGLNVDTSWIDVNTILTNLNNEDLKTWFDEQCNNISQ